MASDGDLIEIIINQTYYGQKVANIFQARLSNIVQPATEQDVAVEVGNDLASAMNEFQIGNVDNVTSVVNNLSQPLLFGQSLLIGSGIVSCNDPSPPMIAFSFRLLRTTKITRTGGKRIVGACDDETTPTSFDSVVEPRTQTFKDLLTGVSSFTTTGGGSFDLEFVIIGRDSLTGQYDLARVNPVAGVDFIRTVSTQNSRKPPLQ